MLKLEYSPVNQAWIFSWNNILLRVFASKNDADSFLKNDTRLELEHVSALLAGEHLRHFAK